MQGIIVYLMLHSFHVLVPQTSNPLSGDVWIDNSAYYFNNQSIIVHIRMYNYDQGFV